MLYHKWIKVYVHKYMAVMRNVMFTNSLDLVLRSITDMGCMSLENVVIQRLASSTFFMSLTVNTLWNACYIRFKVFL